MRRFKKIPYEEWEGLQAELSFMKSQIAELMAIEGLIDDEDIQEPDDDPSDWGVDTDWRARVPIEVAFKGGPPDLYFGPFVLITPEERESWRINLDRASELCDSYLQHIEQLEMQRDALEVKVNKLLAVFKKPPPKTFKTPDSWDRLVENGPE